MPRSDHRLELPHRQIATEPGYSKRNPRKSDRSGDNELITLDTSNLDPPPPPYEDVPRISEIGGPGVTSPPEVLTSIPVLSMKSRLFWPAIIILPLSVAIVLLYLSTSSTESFRATFPILRIDLPMTEFDSLYAVSASFTSNSSMTTSSSSAAPVFEVLGSHSTSSPAAAYITVSSGEFPTSTTTTKARRNNVTLTGGGDLIIGFWGWCLEPRAGGTNSVICSEPSVWFNVTSLSSTAGLPPSSPLSEAFDTFLIHGVLLHGIAILMAMSSLVPVGLHTWKRYVKNDPLIEAGWLQHGTMLAALTSSLGAWVIDSIMELNLSDRLTMYGVSAGPGTTFAGVSSLLLSLALLASAVPVLLRHFSRQRRYIKYWRDVENVGEEGAADLKARERTGKAGKRRRQERRSGESGRRRDRLRRMTRWLGSYESEQDRSKERSHRKRSRTR